MKNSLIGSEKVIAGAQLRHLLGIFIGHLYPPGTHLNLKNRRVRSILYTSNVIKAMYEIGYRISSFKRRPPINAAFGKG